VRNKIWEEAQNRAHRLPVELTFPMALGVLPSLFLITAGPTIIKMVEFFDTFQKPGGK
jgi:hypothetical protein